MDLTCAMFDLKESTVRGWLKKPLLVRKWLPIAHMLNYPKVLSTLPRKDVNVWGEQLDIQFSGNIDFTAFAHLEKAAITMDPSSVVMLSEGTGPSQGNLSTQKKVQLLQNRKQSFTTFPAKKKGLELPKALHTQKLKK